jgi:plastocyanin
MRSPVINVRVGTMILCGLFAAMGHAQTADASIHVEVSHHHEPAASKQTSNAGVVVWLTSNSALPPSPAARSMLHYTLVQKDKQFSPHILVVPTGSNVDFPNLDPFFHNVFSLFNGKRFDLGLYEAHTQRSVLFDRDGVSYIFCNIHPEMGAVVVALSTPYYAISSRDGNVVLHNLPSGRYRLHLWAENVPLDRLEILSRNVDIGHQNIDLGSISLAASGNVMTHHQNKFGESYPPTAKDPY